MQQQSEIFEVELPNGDIIEGPTKEAALAAARRYLNKNKPEDKSSTLKPITSRENRPGFARATKEDPNLALQRDLQRQNKFQSPDLYNELNNLLASAASVTRTGASTATGMVAGLASASPLVGSFAAGATDELLRDIIGEKSGTILTRNEKSVIPRAIEAGITNEILGRIVGALFKGGKELVKPGSFTDPELMKLKPTTGQATDSQALQVFENIFAPTTKNEAAVVSHEAIKKAGQELIENFSGRTNISLDAPFEQMGRINSRFRKLETLNKIIDQPKQLKKFLLRGKSTRLADTQAYELTRLMNDSVEMDGAGNAFISGTKLQNLWKDPVKQESYGELFNQQNRSDISQFFKNIAKVEQKGPLGTHPAWMLRLTSAGLQLGPAIVAGMQTGNYPVTGAVLTAGSVGLNQVAKLLTKPTTARLMVAMAQGQLPMPSRVAGRIIGQALRGTTMDLIEKDGSIETRKIGSHGQFIPLD